MLGGCDLCVQTLLLDEVQQQRQQPGDQALLVPSQGSKTLPALHRWVFAQLADGVAAITHAKRSLQKRRCTPPECTSCLSGKLHRGAQQSSFPAGTPRNV